MIFTTEESRCLRFHLEATAKGENWLRERYKGLWQWWTWELKNREKAVLLASVREKLFALCPHFAEDSNDIDAGLVIADVLADVHEPAREREETGRNDCKATGGRGGSDIHSSTN